MVKTENFYQEKIKLNYENIPKLSNESFIEMSETDIK